MVGGHKAFKGYQVLKFKNEKDLEAVIKQLPYPSTVNFIYPMNGFHYCWINSEVIISVEKKKDTNQKTKEF